MNDPIVDEIRRVRDAHAARFDYDLDAIFRDIKQREKQYGLLFADGVARQNPPIDDATADSREIPQLPGYSASARIGV